jgi:hypothetical protein
MGDGKLRKETSNENEGEHTLADAATRIVARAGGAAMSSPVGRSQP